VRRFEALLRELCSLEDLVVVRLDIPRSRDAGPIVERRYPLRRPIVEELRGKNVKKYFSRLGIPWPGGTAARLLPDANVLVVRHPQANHGIIAKTVALINSSKSMYPEYEEEDVFLAKLKGRSKGEDEQETSFAFRIRGKTDPSRCYVVLTNTGPRTATFSLDVNGLGFFGSNADAVSKILAIPSADPPQRRIWRFLRDHSYYYYSCTIQRWQSSPALFLNSIGFGDCSDTAETLGRLWQEQGYRTRTWGLGGHVVPEVYADGRWEMYDPSFRVYYHDEQGNVAGIEQLAGNSRLVSSPLDPINPPGHITYSAWQASKYASTNDNAASELKKLSGPEYQLMFQLPPTCALSLPVPCSPFNPHVTVSHGRPSPPRVAMADLRLPPRWAGTVDIALLLHSIEGEQQDKVVIKDKTFSVGSAQLQDFIDLRTSARAENISQLQFPESNGPVRVRYLVNPLLIRLKADNSIRLAGTNLSGVRAGLRTLDRRPVTFVPESKE